MKLYKKLKFKLIFINSHQSKTMKHAMGRASCHAAHLEHYLQRMDRVDKTSNYANCSMLSYITYSIFVDEKGYIFHCENEDGLVKISIDYAKQLTANNPGDLLDSVILPNLRVFLLIQKKKKDTSTQVGKNELWQILKQSAQYERV
jgi:hypothetical protein